MEGLPTTPAQFSVLAAASSEASEPEALQVLTAEARRHATSLPAEWLARHALQVTAGTDFAVSRDALDGLVRRALAVKRDRIEILRRPRRGASARGSYRVGRRGSGERQYDVWLESVESLQGSCMCPDYAKAGLGLCKHLLRVVADVVGRRRASHHHDGGGPRLCWDPVRPFTGVGDWLERVFWCDRGATARGALATRAQALFAGTGPVRRLERLRGDDDVGRSVVVETLLAWIEREPGCAEPALPPLLRAERERLTRRNDAVPALEVVRHLGGLRQKLFPYQREGVRRFLADGRLLLADDMGLGKTAQAIAACHVLFAAGRVKRGMIVVPAALKPQWAREWQMFTDLDLTVVDGSADDRARIYRRRPPGVLLVNYEQVLRDLPLMQRYAPEVVVLDEAQRIKNWAAKTSAHVKRLDARWRLVLTGTPMENRLEELSSILDWVDETALEPRWRLASWHAQRADGGREVVGARNLETLRARLRPCLLRRLRTEVLHQLPSRRDTLVSVPLTDAQRGAHEELGVPIATLAAQARRRPLTQPEFLRLMSLLTQQRIICNGLAQRDFEEVWPDLARGRRATETTLGRLASPKLAELRERIAAIAIDQGRKVVVFSQWRRMLKLASWAVADLLGDAGLRAVFFTGEESQRRRTQNLVDFHDDPAARVLFATDAGGIGLNLQRAASCCINIDLPWNPAVLEQRIGRVHRYGQKQPVEVYALVSEGGIEARIAGVVGDKKALFRGLFDGTTDAVDFAQSGSFLSRLEQIVERPVVAARDDRDPADDGADDIAGDAVADGALHERERAGDDTEPVVAAAAGVEALVSRDALTALLGQISVRATADGRVAVEAPPAAAATAASLLRALAAMLDATTGTGDLAHRPAPIS